jgi:hypothetical protein
LYIVNIRKKLISCLNFLKKWKRKAQRYKWEPPYKKEEYHLIQKEKSERREFLQAHDNIVPIQYLGDHIIKPEIIETTPKDIKYIRKNIDNIVYAEWAHVGAMGCCGTARVFLFTNGKCTGFKSESPKQYKAMYNLILENLSFSKFETQDAGFGNYAWKNRSTKFLCCDKENGFVFENNGACYFLPCSVRGVYSNLRTTFAEKRAAQQ